MKSNPHGRRREMKNILQIKRQQEGRQRIAESDNQKARDTERKPAASEQA